MRRDQPLLRVLPPHQSLFANDLEGAEMDLGLEMNSQFIIGYGTHQIAGLRYRLAFAPARVGVKNLNPLAVLLGLVHSLVCQLQQSGAIHAVKRTLGDSNGNTQRDRLMIDQHGLTNGIDNLLRNEFGVFEALGERKQAGKFIATQARNGIGFANDRDQALGHLAQGTVTTMVTQAIVDLFEEIQVHHHYGERFAISLALEDQLIEAIEKQGSIGQPGEWIIEAEILKPIA